MPKKRWTAADIPNQQGRVAIVTGANSGIGLETARELARAGALVIAATRSEARGRAAVDEIRQEIPNAKIEWMALDLASLESVRAFVANFRAKYDRLDLLINNAGVMMPATREATAEGFELQFGTNHVGHFALTVALLDLMRDTKNARVVNVASSAQNLGGFDLEDLNWNQRRYRRAKSYGASKIANMLFTLELQRRLEAAGDSVTAVACHPGWTTTNLQRHSLLIRMLNPFFGMKTWQGALPTLYAAVSPEARGGKYYGPDGLGTLRGYPTENKPAAVSRDAIAAKRLWELSEQLVETPSQEQLRGTA